MELYGIIVTGSEQRSGVLGEPIITKEGDKFWVVNDLDGWVPASSIHISDKDKPPFGLKVWETKKEAEDFARKWEGHPWWCKPINFEIIKVKPKYKPVLDGYDIVTSGIMHLTKAEK